MSAPPRKAAKRASAGPMYTAVGPQSDPKGGVAVSDMVLGVVGAGTIGTGVAHAAAASGLQIILVDVSPAALDKARRTIARNARLYRMVDPAFRDVDRGATAARIDATTELERLERADFVIENVTENWAVKQELYRRLDHICREKTYFGVNTSAIPITRVGGVSGRAAQVVGMHFMNPVPLMPTVELIRAVHTSAATLAAAEALVRRLGKTSVTVNDSPGFVSNRVMMLMVNEAMFLVHENVAPAEDVDRLLKSCFGHKMGPLETADLIGLDTVLYSLEVLHENFGESKYRPCPLLARMVDAGWLGRKSGRGFYNYASGAGTAAEPQRRAARG